MYKEKDLIVLLVKKLKQKRSNIKLLNKAIDSFRTRKYIEKQIY